MPTEDEVGAYLRTLEGEERAAAEEYVRTAKRLIAPAYRRGIDRALGWTPVDCPLLGVLAEMSGSERGEWPIS